MRIRYQAHCTDIGWQEDRVDGRIAGTIGECRALEAFKITELEVEPGDQVGIAAHAFVQDMGWSNPEPIGNDVGSTGLSKHIEAVKIGLTGNDAGKYEIWYRLHVQNYGFLAWSKNGEVNGTTGGNIQAEAIQIIIAKAGENFYPVTDTNQAYIDLTPVEAPAPAVDKRKQALDLARSYVGYTTGTSNDSIFGRRYGGVGAGPWCCYTVRSICEDCGIEFPPTGYVPDAEAWARRNGKWTTKIDTSRLQAVLFDWAPRNAVPNHIGIVEDSCSGGCIALEGNTSGPNGEAIGFWRKRRSNSDIMGYINLT